MSGSFLPPTTPSRAAIAYRAELRGAGPINQAADSLPCGSQLLVRSTRCCNVLAGGQELTGGAHGPAMAPITEARWSALSPRLRLPPPTGADGVAAAAAAAASFSCRCNVAELVDSSFSLYLFLCSSSAFRRSSVRVDKNLDMIALAPGWSLVFQL